jgi:biotin carboxyl carrier protein
MTKLLTISCGTRTASVRVDVSGDVAVDDRRFHIEPLGGGLYRASDGPDHWLIAVAGPAEDRWLAVNGRVVRCEVTAASQQTPRRRSAADDLTAPMPATVLSVPVVAGALVTSGEVLVVLEAMKMELAVRAPRDGVVRAVHCTVGELVQPGVPLLELD